MKYILVIFSVAAGLLASDYYPVRFEDGYAYTAGSTALYVYPDLPEEIIVTVPPGELLEIPDFTGLTITFDLYQFGWYEAVWIQDSVSYSGYVFEPDLALSHLPLGEDTLLVYSTIGFREDAVTGVLSVIVSGEVQTSLFVQPAWLQGLLSFNVRLCLLDPSGLWGVRNLVSLYSGKWTMEGLEREYLIAWTDDGQLIEGPQTVGAALGGPTNYWTEVILPSDEGGGDEQVMFNLLGEAYNPDTDTWDVIIDELDVYLWTGEEFIAR